jgi:hypothetical protein
MRSKIIFTFLIVFFSSCTRCPQKIGKDQELSMFKTGYKELSMLLIKDTNLVPILDSVVRFEKKCKYYDDSLFFIIRVWPIKENEYEVYVLRITSFNDIIFAVDPIQPYLGYFYYQNHLFYVEGQDAKKFFSITKTTKKFRYILDENSFPWNDDSHTSWIYYYIGNRFLFDEESSYSCE